MNTTLEDKYSRIAALKPASNRAGADHTSRGFTVEHPEGSGRLAELLGAQARKNRFGEHLVVRKWFSQPEEFAFEGTALNFLAPCAAPEAADPREWLFLDTETTGLAGGTGTYAFLVGIAWWDAGGLEVEQFFMRDHGEEHSMLQALAERLKERRVLVTFNGKSFDWPLLETRYRMTRSIAPPAPSAHLDFLHPARNLWRMKLGSVRLTELERSVLGWKREGDVASELIPQIYFDFLRGGSPQPLVAVFYHNQMDLRGLAGLAGRILALLAEPETQKSDALELFGVSRIYERRGHTHRAQKLYQQSIQSDLPPLAKRQARRSLAQIARREGNFAFAADLWRSLLGPTREGIEAYEQLAIHYEHRAREPQQAARLAQQALLDLRRAKQNGDIAASAHRRARARFEHRLNRLAGKMKAKDLTVGRLISQFESGASG